ncbi:MAG TPA: rhomboid family intramembrane serine protease [Candidatus Hydrogenedens sp.]|nr:rhomboid family intramembrane serine protease [Candidatus Hydrogenedens sp.]HOL20266.1 rhomboid family intramembrane serine protease [Candidatus Hydrogenedens sp.]
MFPIRDYNPRKSTPIVVISLIAFNTFIYFQYFDFQEQKLLQLFSILGIVPAHFRFITLITHQFLHGGLLHLISNMWALWIFGDNIEDRIGHGRFLIFYLLCGISAGLIHTITQPSSTVPCVGASGAISGVIGSYLFLYPTARIWCVVPIIIYLYSITVPAIVFGIIWFLIQLMNGLIVMASNEDVAGVAWWAHIGGFIAGILLLPLFLKKEEPDESDTDMYL